MRRDRGARGTPAETAQPDRGKGHWQLERDGRRNSAVTYQPVKRVPRRAYKPSQVDELLRQHRRRTGCRGTDRSRKETFFAKRTLGLECEGAANDPRANAGGHATGVRGAVGPRQPHLGAATEFSTEPPQAGRAVRPSGRTPRLDWRRSNQRFERTVRG